jgi:quercetin dioxygenase-like cupin family protein
MSESEGHAYTKTHQLSGEALLFDLDEQARSVLAEARLASVRRAGRTLAKDGSLRLTLVGFVAGGSLDDHKAGGPVSIQVLTGEVEIKVGGRSEQLREKQTLVLASDVTHSLSATTDAVILLSIPMQR